jgi:hypothetical protein
MRVTDIPQSRGGVVADGRHGAFIRTESNRVDVVALGVSGASASGWKGS